MPPRQRSTPDPEQRRPRPATTPQRREDQLVSMAVDLAERQLRDGTASAQVISHYLKLGSSRERLEQERLARENELTAAKIEAIESHKRIEGMYTEALNAMRRYAGQPQTEIDYELED